MRLEIESRILRPVLASSETGFHAAEFESAIHGLLDEYGEALLPALVGLVRESPEMEKISHSNRADELSEAIARVLLRAYKEGRIGSLGAAIDSLQVAEKLDTDRIGRKVASSFYRFLRQTADSALIERAFVEICNDHARLHSGLGSLAETAGQVMGYEQALASVHLDNRIGEQATGCAVRAIISGWVGSDPVACSTFVGALPEGSRRDRYISDMVGALARFGSVDEALEWLPMIPSDSRYLPAAREAIDLASER